ncbi:hypothetical protein A2574_03080 [Candidatus Shapirobacteria bacterium RIFOXYD1_FULL_38_32]|nr:MAG: hypothetical protein A2195_01440 [Candidatus Shapirobacteria bacterium RIFOXYA1_FULL_39_17]OGL57812.1 MAG: hypothetical protein A2574_03080 [Candidatus Shapirobacteria bacterium RIFOXYD1_FULL_38_32]HAP37863.1 hypothetical protein [Candidatus Shapirobacteria bacterium]HCU55270.1 hypothetical protein [Candidatus Shapirobacteria bacterium]
MELDLSLEKISTWKYFENYLADNSNKKTVKEVFNFAKKAHKGQRRISGNDFFTHPVWVAKVVAQLNIGDEAIMAALLHDVVEDTNINLETIANNFGDEVALLVNGMTEVRNNTKGIEVHKTSIENFRHFLFSSVNDIRVLIIRLVDKLHNGLTIESMSETSKRNYATRIFGIYSPVAEYVGLHYFKRILDDIAFRILYPEETKNLEEWISKQKKYEKKALEEVSKSIESTLNLNNISNFEISSRIKSLYSTYLTMKKKGKNTVKDRVGVRIICSKLEDCYMILGLLHSRYQYLADEFNDYISSPKANGYRSLQTTVLWKNDVTVEIQIRTFEMHDFDEFGPASHIAYKQGSNKGYEWVKDLVKWQKNDKNVSNYRINVLDKFVYVFTPKGDTLQLPIGSTAIDFAYRVHTDIGDHCTGAMINNKMNKINTELKTGDLVEILTSKKINVSREWLRFVKTSWAREHIRKITKI